MPSVLVDRPELDLVKFAADDKDRYQIQGLHVDPVRTEATNGHIAVRLNHNGYDVADFPVVQGDRAGDLPAAGLTIPRDAVARVLHELPKKSTLPILRAAKVGGTEDGGVCIVATDLETPTIVCTRKDEIKFPDMDQVMPAKELRPVKVVLSAKYLRLVADWAMKHATHGHGVRILLADTQDARDSQAVRIEVVAEDRRVLECALMPMQDTE